MVMSFVRRAALTSLAPLLLFGACAEDKPDPPAAEPTSSPPSATASAAAEPWTQQTEEGAKAFATHWFDLFNAARLQFETGPLIDASHEECATCSNFVSTIETWESDGTSYESEPWEVRQMKVLASTPSTAELNLMVWRPAETITPAKGPTQRNGGSRGTHTATLSWVDGAWKMQELVIAK